MSKDTVLSSVDDISQGITSIDISDNGDICGSCTDNTTTEICANYSKEGGSLKSCAACNLVKYCSRDCQASHRPQHKKECRRRVAEFHDERLFKDPPPLEDCPICFIRLPVSNTGKMYQTCCGKVICCGCIHAVKKTDGGVGLCPFCRLPPPKSDEEMMKRLQKRMDAGDGYAICGYGSYYAYGMKGLPQDIDKALDLWHRAVKLGYYEAYHNIGYTYDSGKGVAIDKKKANHYYELCAMKGSLRARHNLGAFEKQVGNMERAAKHYMIAARSGGEKSLKTIRGFFMLGYVSKDEYANALQAYQRYLGEVKNSQRDEAAAYDDQYIYLCQN